MAIATPNTNPESDTAATAAKAPIGELWNDAWNELRHNTALFEEYETRLTAFSPAVAFPSLGKHERAHVMKVLLEKRIEELESGRWKIGFQNNQFAVKDLIEPVVGIVNWAKEYIGKAAQASPYSSVAWAGVCLLLPVRPLWCIGRLLDNTVHLILTFTKNNHANISSLYWALESKKLHVQSVLRALLHYYANARLGKLYTAAVMMAIQKNRRQTCRYIQVTEEN